MRSAAVSAATRLGSSRSYHFLLLTAQGRRSATPLVPRRQHLPHDTLDVMRLEFHYPASGVSRIGLSQCLHGGIAIRWSTEQDHCGAQSNGRIDDAIERQVDESLECRIGGPLAEYLHKE